MKRIEKYNRIEKRDVLDCRIKSLKELVKNYDLTIDSCKIMLICESCLFQYGRLSIKDTILKDIPYATASHNNIEERFFESFNIKYIKESIGKSEDEWNHMKALIDSDIPVLFKIDCRFLNRMGASTKPMKINVHYLSSLLLVGYDEESQTVDVILTNTDTQDTPQIFSFDDFQKYRNTECIPFSPNYTCYYINENDLGYISDEAINKATVIGIKNIANNMLSKNYCESITLNNCTCSNLYIGIFAMRKLEEDLMYMYSNFVNEERYMNNIRLSLLFLRNNMMFGSYSAYREELGICLCRISCINNFGRLEEVGNEFIILSQKWKALFIELSKAGHCKELKKQLFKIIDIWHNILSKESLLFNNMVEITNTID